MQSECDVILIEVSDGKKIPVAKIIYRILGIGINVKYECYCR